MSNKVFYKWSDFTTDEIFESDLFEGADWLEDYLAEKKRNSFPKLRYSPFNVWVHREHRSKYFNVNKDGFRIVNYNQVDADKKLFILGDSIIFGEHYVRDQDTLPSQVAKFLSEVDAKTEVFNFSQTGYTLMNQLNLITKLISKGDVPDEIFIYFGINEIWQNILLDQEHLAQSLFHKNRIYGYNWKNYFKDEFRRKLKKNSVSPLFYLDNIDNLNRNCHQEIIKTFHKIKIIKSILSSYDIKFKFFILPTIFNANKELSVIEKKIIKKIKIKHPIIFEIFDLGYRMLSDKLKDDNALINMNNVYCELVQSVFLDFCHCSTTGLRRLASTSIDHSTIYRQN